MVRPLSAMITTSIVLVWGAFAVGMVLWGLSSQAMFDAQEGAPQQAAAAAYSASVSIIAYAIARAVTGALRAVAAELSNWMED